MFVLVIHRSLLSNSRLIQIVRFKWEEAVMSSITTWCRCGTLNLEVEHRRKPAVVQDCVNWTTGSSLRSWVSSQQLMSLWFLGDTGLIAVGCQNKMPEEPCSKCFTGIVEDTVRNTHRQRTVFFNFIDLQWDQMIDTTAPRWPTQCRLHQVSK